MSELNTSGASVGSGTETPQVNAVAQQEAQTLAGVNLYELPEFKAYQSKIDKQLAAARQASQLAEQRWQEAQAQARQATLQTLDEPQRLVYERDEAIAYANRVQQQIQAEQAASREAAAIEAEIQDIVVETGAPRSAFADATNGRDAWKMALAWAKKNAKEAEDREANKVDLGAGSPPSSETDVDKILRSGKKLSAFELAKLTQPRNKLK